MLYRKLVFPWMLHLLLSLSSLLLCYSFWCGAEASLNLCEINSIWCFWWYRSFWCSHQPNLASIAKLLEHILFVFYFCAFIWLTETTNALYKTSLSARIMFFFLLFHGKLLLEVTLDIEKLWKHLSFGWFVESWKQRAQG